MEKVSSPKLWFCTAIGVGFAGVVTVGIALVIPAISGGCIVIACVLTSCAVVATCTALSFRFSSTSSKGPELTLKQHLERYAMLTIPEDDSRRLGKDRKILQPKDDPAIERLTIATVLDSIDQEKKPTDFSPEAQQFIEQKGLPTADDGTCSWDSRELNHFTGREIQLLLDLFGPKFADLSFSGYRHRNESLPESLDFRHCPELRTLCPGDLRTIEGLAGCTNLFILYLSHCRSLNRDIVIKLNEIPRPDVIVYCTKSSLVIETVEDLKKQFGPAGDGARFLKDHPYCSFSSILNIPKTDASRFQRTDLRDVVFAELQRENGTTFGLDGDRTGISADRPYFSVMNETGRDFCDQLRKMEHVDVTLPLLETLPQDMFKTESGCGLTPMGLLYFVQCIWSRIRGLQIAVKPNPSNSKPWDLIEEFNLSYVPVLERLSVESSLSLRWLRNLGRCHRLRELFVGDRLPALDAVQVKGEILKLHSLRRLIIRHPAFTAKNNILLTDDLMTIFKNNPGLQTITIPGTIYSR